MSIHTKINIKQARLLKEYSVAMFRDTEKPIKEIMFKEVPKNMRYGGYRNTCYDVK